MPSLEFMEQQNTERLDFVPRDYQRNIIAACIERNSLVYLPTGAGKTFIAVQVIKHFSEALNKKYSEGGKRSFFLVTTVALAKQQFESIRQFLPFNCCLLTGENNVDTFNALKWQYYLDSNEIFVMTAQCFADAVARTYISLDCVNVIVFDECHHGRKDHVYHQIMQQFERCKNFDDIRVLGLSGMLVGNDGKTKPATVVEELNKLESTYQSTIITVNNIDDQKNVLVYSTKAKDAIIRYPSQSETECLRMVARKLQILQQYLRPVQLDNTITLNPKTLRESIPMKIKELVNMLKDLEVQINVLGTYGTFLGLHGILVQLELTKRVADREKLRDVVKFCITEVELLIKTLSRMGMKEKGRKAVMENSSQKIQMLFLLLKKFYNDPDREDMQCLIFTERRSSAKILYHLIKCFGDGDENFSLKPDFVVGRNNGMPESIESILSVSNNTLALEKFNNKETNLIVCTNVLEEGIDLQACNLVVVYDPPKTLRSYMQSKGRARDENSHYIIMLEEQNYAKFLNKQAVWKAADCQLKRELIGKTIDRTPPDEENIKEEQKQLWEPFRTSKGALLTALNSITILNQYAQTLPADRFTNIRIDWKREDLNGKTRVIVRLPTQSMMSHEIVGDYRDNVKIAKQDVAFKTCIELYRNGYLTEQLIPVDSQLKIEEYNDIYFEHWEKYKNDNPKKAGTKNNRRYHRIKTPEALKNCGPSVGTNYLYRIEMKPKFDTDNNNALKVFSMLLQKENTFGILTSKRLPKLCEMSLFHTFGEIECSISDLPTSVYLKDNIELQKLQKFHVNIFRDVLNSFQDFFVLDKSSYLIIPIDEYNEIKWPLINEFMEIPKPTRLTKQQIKNMTFEPKDYLYMVINPVYREHTDQNYIVINIVENKNPTSQFPDQNTFLTYEDYFKEKYNIEICQKDQFLIEVKGISKNLKLFFPGCGISGKQKKYERINDNEEYIPEICHNYKFPGEMWIKATLLPSICHRVFYMLLAEEMRQFLIKEDIDKGLGRQIYKLDVDYGNYEERAEIAKMNDMDEEERLEAFRQILKQMNEKEIQEKKSSKSHTRTDAMLIWGDHVPLDLDRNWLDITELDIEYYSSFVNGTENASSDLTKHIEKLSTAQRSFAARSIKNEEICTEIYLLQVNNLNRGIQQKDLVKVLTTANAGDVFDMERFEMIGDSFLKFITSLYLYKTHDSWHEGYLTALKGKIVSNKNLFYLGNNFGLSNMLKACQFSNDSSFAPSTMLPSNIKDLLQNDRTLLRCLYDVNTPLSYAEIESGVMVKNLETFMNAQADDAREKYVDKTLVGFINEQHIGDKVVADAVEALLGCTVSSIGIASGLKLCQKLKILPDQNLDNLLTEQIVPRIVFETGVKVINQGLLEKTLKYNFKNSIYLTQALTHASYPNKSYGTYQQLEYLGDAVLDFLITSYIYERCPKMSPGKLTDLRSALVNNVTLACIIVRNNIHKHLMYENQMLGDAIKNFVNFQRSQHHRVTDQVILMSTENDTNIAKSIDVPKALGDIFESIVGAIYLDSGMSLIKTWEIIYNLMHNEINEFIANVPLQIIRRLYEFQGGKAEPKFFNTEIIEGDENVAVPLRIKNKNGEEEFFIGFGKNRKIAKEAAAKKALIELM